MRIPCLLHPARDTWSGRSRSLQSPSFLSLLGLCGSRTGDIGLIELQDSDRDAGACARFNASCLDLQTRPRAEEGQAHGLPEGPPFLWAIGGLLASLTVSVGSSGETWSGTLNWPESCGTLLTGQAGFRQNGAARIRQNSFAGFCGT